jgi:hypothetical protein
MFLEHAENWIYKFSCIKHFIWDLILTPILTDLKKIIKDCQKKKANVPDLDGPGRHSAGPAHLWHHGTRGRLHPTRSPAHRSEERGAEPARDNARRRIRSRSMTQGLRLPRAKLAREETLTYTERLLGLT